MQPRIRTDIPVEARVAIVTGGATGIGEATVRAFARSGIATVVAYHSSRDRAILLADEVGAYSPSIAVRADITSDADVSALVRHTIEVFGRLDILVNNAGGSFLRESLAGLPRDIWDSTLALNLTGPYLCCRAAIDPLARQRGSAIVNVASSSAFNGGSGGSTHYAAAKAGLVALTKGLARELANRGIRVNAVAPAAVETAFHSKVPPVRPLETWPETIPLNRLAAPEEVAAVIAFLVTDAASFITGQTIHINGGSLLA